MESTPWHIINLFLFRAPNNYGTSHSIPRPDPPTNSTMIPAMIPMDDSSERDKIGGEGYDSSKMKQSNWRLLGLGIYTFLQFK